MNEASLALASRSRSRGASDAFAQLWRDRKSEADRMIEDLYDSENVLHRAWRKVKRSWPENSYEEELQRISQGWQARAR